MGLLQAWNRVTESVSIDERAEWLVANGNPYWELCMGV